MQSADCKLQSSRKAGGEAQMDTNQGDEALIREVKSYLHWVSVGLIHLH
jgi:hypothetical protein